MRLLHLTRERANLFRHSSDEIHASVRGGDVRVSECADERLGVEHAGEFLVLSVGASEGSKVARGGEMRALGRIRGVGLGRIRGVGLVVRGRVSVLGGRV